MHVDLEEEVCALLIRCNQLEMRLEAERRDAERRERATLRDLLEVVDALDRILASPTPGDPAKALERQRRNVESTRRLLLKQLARAGVAPVDLAGREADPAVADVEDVEDNDTVPDETVLREIVRGYTWRQEILRRASVIVSRHP